MLRTALITIIALAVMAPTASARMTETAKLYAARPIATVTWQGSKCRGRVTIHTASIATRALARFEARIMAKGGFEVLDGYSRRDTCEVWIRPHLTQSRFCDVLVHEEGHLAGFAHLGDKGPHPMDPVLARVMWFKVGQYPPCHGVPYVPTAGATTIDTPVAPIQG